VSDGAPPDPPDGAAGPADETGEIARAAEHAAREVYGRLLARLSRRTRDIAAAEDALSEAFARALATWPESGVPRSPEAWLTTVACNAVRDDARRAATGAAAATTLRLIAEERCEASPADERLGLILAASHPAIAADVHAPLILQTVFGVTAAEMVPVFLASPAGIAQRLVRAKRKIKAAGIPFTVDPADRPERLARALHAIYALYTVAARTPAAKGADERARDAWHLARLVAILSPEEPEALGLAALVGFCEARRLARRSPDGAYVPLSRQDTALWDGGLIADSEVLLSRAAWHRSPGRFQIEAAIQSAHCDLRRSGSTASAAIAALYDALVAYAPSVGADVARAAAHGEAHGPAAGLSLLERIPARSVATPQPFWAVRAHLLARAGQCAEGALEKAMALTDDAAVKNHLAGLHPSSG